MLNGETVGDPKGSVALEQAGPGGATCKLTIALPVFNGEQYVGRAIESILRQTYDDFQLIVLDNASTDGTAAIVQRFVDRDPRVRYLRNERNLGAGPNFNRGYALCTTPYFKWAACDDELEAEYLARCVEALERDPTVVLAHSYVRQIDQDSAPAPLRRPGPSEYVELVDDERGCDSVYRPVPAAAESPDRLTRFCFHVLTRDWCTEVFGVIRTSALAATPLIDSFSGSDRSLLAELALIGRFTIVPAPLFMNRDHRGRFIRSVFVPASHGSAGRHQVSDWFDTSKRPRRYQMDWWILFGAYFRMINRNITRHVDRLPYYVIAIRWLTVRWNRIELVKDLLYRLDPRMLQWATERHARLRGAR